MEHNFFVSNFFQDSQINSQLGRVALGFQIGPRFAEIECICGKYSHKFNRTDDQLSVLFEARNECRREIGSQGIGK